VTGRALAKLKLEYNRSSRFVCFSGRKTPRELEISNYLVIERYCACISNINLPSQFLMWVISGAEFVGVEGVKRTAKIFVLRSKVSSKIRENRDSLLMLWPGVKVLHLVFLYDLAYLYAAFCIGIVTACVEEGSRPLRNESLIFLNS
jgi:hypothetical protein